MTCIVFELGQRPQVVGYSRLTTLYSHVHIQNVYSCIRSEQPGNQPTRNADKNSGLLWQQGVMSKLACKQLGNILL